MAFSTHGNHKIPEQCFAGVCVQVGVILGQNLQNGVMQRSSQEQLGREQRLVPHGVQTGEHARGRPQHPAWLRVRHNLKTLFFQLAFGST